MSRFLSFGVIVSLVCGAACGGGTTPSTPAANDAGEPAIPASDGSRPLGSGGMGMGGSRGGSGGGGAGQSGGGGPAAGGAPGSAVDALAPAKDGPFSRVDAVAPVDAAPRPPADGPPPSRTGGCGKAVTGTSSFVRAAIDVHGTSREYYLWVPKTYVPTRSYPVIFKWHGTDNDALTSGLGIETESQEDAIVVAGNGINMHWDLTAKGVDVALFDAIYAHLLDSYCVDTTRIFSYGFSAGGMMSFLLGCVRGDVIRGFVSIEGFIPTADACTGQSAPWIVNSVDDEAVKIAQGIAARDAYVKKNGCASTSTKVSPFPCVRYDGCAADYPVVWCQTTGPHSPQGVLAIPGGWAFFKSLGTPALP